MDIVDRASSSPSLETSSGLFDACCEMSEVSRGKFACDVVVFVGLVSSETSVRL